MRGPWVAIPFALVLAACGGGTATPSGPAATATPAASETATPSPESTPTPAASPTATPAPAPTATPSNVPACWPMRGGSGSRAAVVDVRVGAQPASDRLVVEFDHAVPAWEMRPNPQGMTFTGGGRGEPETLAGSYGIRLDISDVDWMQDRYPHGRDLVPRFPVLQEVRVVGDFEGIVNLGIGLSRSACPAVTVLSSPPRLVIDFPTG